MSTSKLQRSSSKDVKTVTYVCAHMYVLIYIWIATVSTVFFAFFFLDDNEAEEKLKESFVMVDDVYERNCMDKLTSL